MLEKKRLYCALLCFQYTKFSSDHLPFVVDMCLAPSPCPRHTADLVQPFQAKDLMSVFLAHPPTSLGMCAAHPLCH